MSRADNARYNYCHQDAQKVVESQGVQGTPGNKTAEHVQSAVGKIRQAADTVNQCKAEGIKRQGDTVDCAVNNYIHLWSYFFIHGGSWISPVAMLLG